MPSRSVEPATAEGRFRLAFERLKAGKPTVLPQGAAVSQNNVAREAGCRDPGALKKARYPALVQEIKSYIELHPVPEPADRRDMKERSNARRSLAQELAEARQQRDMAQSILASANRRIVELTEENRDLQRRIDLLQPPPTLILPRKRK